MRGAVCACDLPAQTDLHPNVFTLWQEHIAKLFTSHPAIRYAAYARGGVQSQATRQQRDPLAVARLHSPRLHFATRECVSAGDLGSLHRFFPTFRREDRAAVEHTVGGCLRGGERQMGKLINLQHQVWKLMVRDWLGHFGGEYLILMFRVSHTVGIEHLNLKLEIKLCLSC